MRVTERIIALSAEHVRLCINACALRPDSSRPSSAGLDQRARSNRDKGDEGFEEERLRDKAINAACQIVLLHADLSTAGGNLSYATDVSPVI